MLRSTLLNTGSSLLYFLLQWLTTVAAVRFASFETAGVYALAISFSNILYFLALFGIRNYQVSDVEGRFSAGQYLAARLMTAAASIVAFFILGFCSGLDNYHWTCYSLYMLFKLGEAYTEGFFSELQRANAYGRLALSYSGKGILASGAFFVCLYRTHDLIAAIAAMDAGYLLAVLLFDVAAWRRMGIVRPVFQGCGGIIRSCVPLLLISLTVPAMNYAVRWAVEQVSGSYLLGQFSSLSSVIAVMSTLGGAVFVVLLPQLSRWKIESRWDQMLRLFCFACVAFIVIGLLAVLVGKALGPTVCSMIFGEEILGCIDLLVPLLITSTLLMGKAFFSSMLIPLERSVWLLVGEYAGAALCIFTAFPLTQRQGLHGANLSYMLGVVLQIVLLSSACFKVVLSAKKGADHDKSN